MDIDPRSIAFLFPGQGSQHVGMGRALAAEEPVAAQVFSLADEILGYPLSRICWEGPVETLNDTEHTQPALLTHSVAALKALLSRHPKLSPACTAGHSLGEFSALVAAGSLSFQNALWLVRRRGQLMKKAGQDSPGGMSAILGMDIAMVEKTCEEACRETRSVVTVANDNCPGQIVISGDEAALSLACQRLRAAGARRVVRLAVSIAAHSPLMEPIQHLFNQAIREIPINDPVVSIYGNVHARPMRGAAEVRADLLAQLTSRVRWTETVRAMIEKGVRTTLEIGSGNVLSGLVRRIDRRVRTISIGEPDSLEIFGA